MCFKRGAGPRGGIKAAEKCSLVVAGVDTGVSFWVEIAALLVHRWWGKASFADENGMVVPLLTGASAP